LDRGPITMWKMSCVARVRLRGFDRHVCVVIATTKASVLLSGLEALG
jgi:hypothetical protein